MNHFREMLNLAVKAVEDAAAVVRKSVHMGQVVAEMERDVKIRADYELEAVTVRTLSRKSMYPILTEERGLMEDKDPGNGYRWIVDPLDGSLNFSRAIPISCISIGLWKGWDPLLGVILDFHRDELFTGLVGEGAWLNNSPITAGKVRKKKDAVLCTGFPVSTDFSQPALLKFVENIRQYKKVRLLGSAALSLAYVAAGRADTYLEEDIAVWDVAAGLALVLAAGGVVHISRGRSENRLIVEAGNKWLLSGKTGSLS